MQLGPEGLVGEAKPHAARSSRSPAKRFPSFATEEGAQAAGKISVPSARPTPSHSSVLIDGHTRPGVKVLQAVRIFNIV